MLCMYDRECEYGNDPMRPYILWELRKVDNDLCYLQNNYTESDKVVFQLIVTKYSPRFKNFSLII